MIKAVIVEDSARSRDTLYQHLMQYGEASNLQFSIQSYESGLLFLSEYRSDADIVFMDIELPDIDGMETSRRLRMIDENVILIFVTNMAQYAIRGYEVEALDYFLKPVAYNAFALKMKRVIRRIEQRTNENSIIVNSYGGKKRILIRDINYVDISGHLLMYHLGDTVVEATGSLTAVEATLAPNGFSRCNNNCLVNLRAVAEMNTDTIVVDKTSLSLSRRRKKEFLTQLANYYGAGRK